MALSIGILGTRGIPNHYGGFEQVASYLSRGLVERGHCVTVYSPHDHFYKGDTWEGARIRRCYSPNLGTAGQFMYDLNCIMDARQRHFDVLLLLGYTSSSVWGPLYPKDQVIISNMDGMEWKRTKYSWPVQQFLHQAERLAIRYSHHVIADSTTVRDYLQWQYGVRAKFIPYGAEIFDGTREEHLQEFGLQCGAYSMLVARMEPENNIEMVLEGFCRARPDQRLLIIGDTSHSYGKHLRRRYGGSAGVHFGGALFDQERLHSLRSGCVYYFHGHSVGGTNPSLLEAMASKAVVVAHDNPFNRAVLGKNALYFADARGVAAILERKTPAPEESEMVETNFRKIQSLYSWEKITSAYEQFMLECYAEKHQLLSRPAVPDLTAV